MDFKGFARFLGPGLSWLGFSWLGLACLQAGLGSAWLVTSATTARPPSAGLGAFRAPSVVADVTSQAEPRPA